ncbi:MarR family winged helix-turn-helix transcriptional regulator [Janthinobacterium fluminis]|uniref:MarR family winged helix-turn-helix transcriptional regulator n=1 Tax=Janthinobacterium fluminis TaxID=2987524 RepID=A0ABT5JUY1_9BURK|nr:MarR family winged helix-turn-helix transcriptional regulator [Janthinobacterium fluminis]MDC8756439.1 MarR family winged helix-turn-helix transcriptional regulator [Janthinobacterium fluminis]
MTSQAAPNAAILTDIMLAVFRLNGRLLDKGDEMVKPLKLSSARWQVLGAVHLAGKPLSAPQIAETMGVSRQGTQKQLNKLEEEGFVAPRANPRHERSPLYALTPAGESVIGQTMALHQRWATSLAAGLSGADLENTLHMLRTVYARLDAPVLTEGAA